MKAIAADAPHHEVARQREFAGKRRLVAMESRIEAGDLRRLRCDGSDGPDGGDVVRLVQRRERYQRLKTGHHLLIDNDRLGIDHSAVHNAVSYAAKSRFAADMVREPAVNGRDTGAVVLAGDGLVRDAAALRIRNLQPGRWANTLDLPVQVRGKRPVGARFEHRELDAGRPGIDDEDRLAHRLRLNSMKPAVGPPLPTRSVSERLSDDNDASAAAKSPAKQVFVSSFVRATILPTLRRGRGTSIRNGRHRVPGALRDRRIKRCRNCFLDALQPHEFDLLADFFRNVVEILAVPRRQHHPPDAGTVGGHHLLLDAADREDQAAQADLARHGGIAAHRSLGHQRDQGHQDGDAGARTILRRRSRRHVDVYVDAVEAGRVDTERCRAVLDDAQRCLRAFLHHVAELARQNESAAAGKACRLDEQNIAAHRRPGESGGDARHARAHRQLALEGRGSQDGNEIVAINADRAALALRDPHRGVTQRLSNLPLQIADAGLPCVVHDDLVKRAFSDLDLIDFESVGLHLPAHQIAPGDLALFRHRVAGEADDLHAVAQRPRYGVEQIRGGDEHHAAEIEWNAEVVVAEAVVLLRVEHLEEGGGRIALDAGAELVDLIEHHHAVARAGLADGLYDVARQRPDIGTPVPADLALVVHAAETDAYELAIHRPRDRLTKRRLAHSGRADKAQDRRLAMGRELADREEFDDPPLDLVETVVVFIENAACFDDVDRRLLRQGPRQFDQPVEVGPHHAGLGGGFRHALEAPQLLAGRLFNLLRHPGLGDRLGKLLDFGGLALLALAELALDSGHLLPQQHLALALVERRLGLLADLRRKP